MTNIITACFGGTRFTNTRPAWLIDHGMVLQINGVELPESYFVDFANSKAEQATRVLGNADGVVIPDQYFLSNAPQIFAWVYLTTGDSGFTTLQITIPLSQRPDVSSEPPTPQETDLIEQAIAALNDGVERAETAAENAEQSAAEAKEAAENIKQTVDDALREAKDSGEFDGEPGEPGTNGTTFIPNVDAAGNILWTNNGDLQNPEPRNIMGPKGDTFTYADLTAADKADLIQGPIAEAQTEAVEAVEQKGEDVLAALQEYADLPEDVSTLKSALDEITGGTRNIAYLEQGTINISDGAEQDSTTRCRTNFIPIDTATSLYITRGLWSVRNGIGYDANKQFVASNQFLSDAYADEGRPFRVTNANIKYVRFIYSASNTSQNVTPDYGPFMVEAGEKTGNYVPFETAVDYEARAQIAEVKATPPNHLEMLCEGFDHVAVIGDSLITGTTLNASAVTKSNLNWSWVKRLAVRSGNDWTPYGRAGLTLQTWLTDSTGLPALQAGTTPEVIVVSLGTNDAVSNNYISAFTTNYGTLLDTLHTNFPNALILCLPLWNFAASRTLEYQNTSAAIQTVCESRSFAFYVSMATYEATLKGEYFKQSRISAHYNSLAYSWISDIIAFCIGEVIESNPTEFAYVNFINS